MALRIFDLGPVGFDLNFGETTGHAATVINSRGWIAVVSHRMGQCLVMSEVSEECESPANKRNYGGWRCVD